MMTFCASQRSLEQRDRRERLQEQLHHRDSDGPVVMRTQRNRRGRLEHFLYCKHSRLNHLKQEVQRYGLENQYIFSEDIPPFPRPEFHVSRVKHDTERRGLCCIRVDDGFGDPHRQVLVWWSLAVGPEEIQEAETRLLEETYPNRTEEQAARQRSFLWRFASSPAFGEKSRLGSYRFTFPLQEVLTAYSEQFCSGAPPIMRVFKTSLYKQEVQYSVLVHSPANQLLFSRFPLLPDDDPDAVCAYRDGRFIWRPEAMCKTHGYELTHRPDGNHVDAQQLIRRVFYVWDNVAVALHVENRRVLTFDADRLRQNLRFCWPDEVTARNDEEEEFDDFEDATNLVKCLWPGWRLPLEEERSLLQRYTADFLHLSVRHQTGSCWEAWSGEELHWERHLRKAWLQSRRSILRDVIVLLAERVGVRPPGDRSRDSRSLGSIRRCREEGHLHMCQHAEAPRRPAGHQGGVLHRGESSHHEAGGGVLWDGRVEVHQDPLHLC
ncbi:uncharacterized protein LOC120730613 isoform X3 [Simochromis diagramma]|uniref:uncharacterized protein LOC120730613 isoform X3 n=1 Tax=Simochromis diagramma TaxID=43689 RepID=UPI001A7EAD75|nr:uncharacterized protein LOC120730613 isoform X3 [Simochromis diagramma]